MNKFLLILLAMISAIAFSQKQNDLNYYFTQHDIHNVIKEIPTPESIIGHQVGKWHVSHDKLVEYMRILASASNRISIEERGKTFEDRPLILLTITSEKNHSNISSIRKNHIDLTNNDNKPDTSNMPLVVYQGFSIHGNEASGSNASLLLAYYLAASKDDFVEKLLENTVKQKEYDIDKQ